MSNRLDLTSHSVGVSGVGIEPQPLDARHATDHIPTSATKKYHNIMVLKMAEPQLDIIIPLMK